MPPVGPRERHGGQQQVVRAARLPPRAQAGVERVEAPHEVHGLPVPHGVVQGAHLLAPGLLGAVVLAEVRVGLRERRDEQLAGAFRVQRERVARGVGRHEGVAVTVAAHPRGEAHRHARAGVHAEHAAQRAAQVPLQPGKRPRDGAHVAQPALHLVEDGGAQAAELQRAPHRLDVRADALQRLPGEVRQVPRDLHEVRADRAAPHLGGVRGEGQVELHPREQVEDARGVPAQVAQLQEGVLDALRTRARAAPQAPHALVLLREVHELEVPREGPHEALGGRGVRVHEQVTQPRVVLPGAGLADECPHGLHQLEEALALLLPQHHPERAAQGADVLPQGAQDAPPSVNE